MPRLTRSQVLFLLDAARKRAALLPQAEDLGRAWLRAYPGDLSARTLLAHILLRRGQEEAAFRMAERLRLLAPCDPRPLRLLLSAPSGAPVANACLLALGERPSPRVALPPWGALLAEMFRSLEGGDISLAARSLPPLLEAAPPTPLLAVAHVRLLNAQSSAERSAHTSLRLSPVMRALLERYRERWPEAIPLALWQAELYLESGQEARAVSLLHRAAAEDVGGEVPWRLWGVEHPYRDLWAREMDIPLEMALPAELAALLGWNRLPKGEAGADSLSGERASGKSAPLSGESASPPPGAGNFRGRRLSLPRRSRPVYVILTTRAGLLARYGAPQTRRILKALRSLEAALRSRYRGRVLLLVADDPESTACCEAAPAEAGDPWAIKLLLHDVNARLKARRERIGTLLIVGGEEVVPFHRLPNPVEDDDPDVPSDAPYGSDDENYFVGQWAVGRLPGDASRRAAVLIRQIQGVQARQQAEASRRTRAWWLRAWLRRGWQWLSGSREAMPDAVGYTAAVWWEAALEVIRPVGSARDVLASPPMQAPDFVGSGLYPAALGYFNLHGVKDEAPWFGQCDPRQVCAEDYPVALRPEDVGRSGEVPRLVFSEACYGGYLSGRAQEESVALQFLAHGTQAVAASTVLAYGSLRRPLIAADLLGHTFWNLVAGGIPAGEALRRAKIGMIAEAKKRQGFLEAEDQKTLISFVLYGDPLAQAHVPLSLPKYVPGRAAYASVPAVRDEAAAGMEALQPETVAHVKQVVRAYLPGMEDAEWRCVTGRSAHAKGNAPQRRVVVLRKGGRGGHKRFARLTLDRGGRLVRLSVSR